MTGAIDLRFQLHDFDSAGMHDSTFVFVTRQLDREVEQIAVKMTR